MLVVTNHLIIIITLFKKARMAPIFLSVPVDWHHLLKDHKIITPLHFDVSMPPGDSIQCYLKISIYALNYPIYLSTIQSVCPNPKCTGASSWEPTSGFYWWSSCAIYSSIILSRIKIIYSISYTFLTIIKITDFKGYMDIIMWVL